MRFKKWNIGTPAERDVALLRSAGYPYLLSTVLAARGVTTAEAAAEALERDRSLSMSPMLMRDMDKAVARIQRAISQGETIAVFGDYDVDGITSTVLLMDYLKSCGVRCLRHIPRRIEEGYGLSKEAIQGLRDQGATLMITVDCGITGNEEVDFAASIGLDVVITDHHECKEELPRALAVVDPHRSDCPYPFKHLAGVGVALKLVLALGGESREDALFARYCTLAAIGTIADVMRMEGENRTIAFCGLEALPHTDFVGVHAPTYVDKYDTTADLKDGGTYLLNCPWSAEELEERLPAKMKRDLANKHANFYIMDATKLARDLGLGNRINTILQAAFFQLTKVIPIDLAVEEMKQGNYNSYFKKGGQEIVDLNNRAVDVGLTGMTKVEVPAAWADAKDGAPEELKGTDFVKEIVVPMARQHGDKLPVSLFKRHNCLDGTWENGTTAYSKRGVAVTVPQWNPDACIQCNRCAMACPHAAIRPVLLTEEEKAGAPESFVTVPAKGLGKDAPAYSFRMQVSPYDCLGCGVCLTACPAKGALEMVPFETQREQQPNFDNYAMNEKLLKKDIISDKSVKTAQFAKPYFQFSAACAGCAETTYIKLVTQLFGSRMYVANASGCSSAYGGAMPMTPYSCDSRGFGPCWEQSLFEDNAEFAYGFLRAHGSIHGEVELRLKALKEKGVAVSEIGEYLAKWQDPAVTREVSDALIAALEKAEPTEEGAFVLQNKEYLTKKSVWAFGGDGWAYDIGFGGIDHVLAQNRDINMLVMDTEVYSNTGGQSSKATPTAAVAKFAAGGKEVKKKDLGAIAMSYGYIYVAQVAMGYDQAQTLKAIREAESYPGPAIVIAYCPCLEHGIKAGMSCTQEEMKKAVECGYWHLYRYDPRRIAEGKNPFQLDSPAPDSGKMMDYLKGENRYASLQINFPDRAQRLYEKTVQDAKDRYAKYRKMAED